MPQACLRHGWRSEGAGGAEYGHAAFCHTGQHVNPGGTLTSSGGKGPPAQGQEGPAASPPAPLESTAPGPRSAECQLLWPSGLVHWPKSYLDTVGPCGPLPQTFRTPWCRGSPPPPSGGSLLSACVRGVQEEGGGSKEPDNPRNQEPRALRPEGMGVRAAGPRAAPAQPEDSLDKGWAKVGPGDQPGQSHHPPANTWKQGRRACVCTHAQGR